jgi:hypothetical protein
MKIKDLLLLLENAPNKEKEIWIPSISNERTMNIDFNFDDENNLELYEIGSNDETYTISKINEIVKSKKAFQQN